MWGVLVDSGAVATERVEAGKPEVMQRLVDEVMLLAPGLAGTACFHRVAGPDWEERAAAARRLAEPYGDRAVFLTLRWNAEWTPEHRGFALYWPPGCQGSSALARGLLTALTHTLAPDLPVYWVGLWADACPLLLSAPRPSVRICPGFLTNPADRALLEEPHFRRRFAEALVTGLARNLRLRYIFQPSQHGSANRDLTQPSQATPEELQKALKDTALSGLEMAFLDAEAESQVNALYLCAHALREVARYPDLARFKHNVLAYGADRNDPYERAPAFASPTDCIRTVARVLSRDYLSPDGPFYHGPTLKGIGLTYSFDPHWPYEVAAILQRIRGREPWWWRIVSLSSRLCKRRDRP